MLSTKPKTNTEVEKKSTRSGAAPATKIPEIESGNVRSLAAEIQALNLFILYLFGKSTFLSFKKL